MLLQHQLVFDLLVDTKTIDGTGLARLLRTSRTGLEWSARAAARRVKAPANADDGTTPCRGALVDHAAWLEIADVAAACGGHVIAADARGAIACGCGRSGQRGSWSVLDSSNIEAVRWGREFSAAPRVAQLAVGKDFTVFVVGGGLAYGCGNGALGQLGTAPAPTRSCTTPRPIPEFARTRVYSCAAGDDYSLWIVGDRRAVAGLGVNDHGQLGTGDHRNRTPGTWPQRCRVGLEDGPVRRWRPGDGVGAELVGVTRIAAGTNHAVAVAGGTLYSWGARKWGQLGDTVRTQRAVPMPVRSNPQVPLPCSLDGVTVVDCAAGDGFSLAVDADGGVHAAGRNRSGAMGLGAAPFHVSLLQRFHRVPIGEEDVRWAVANANRPDLSLNEIDARWSGGPRHERVVAVACGPAHAICRTVDGRVYTWGSGYQGGHLALGHGVLDGAHPLVVDSPRLVPDVGRIVHVAAGGTRDGAASSLIVRADGTVLAASNDPSIYMTRPDAPGRVTVERWSTFAGRFFQLRPAIPRDPPTRTPRPQAFHHWRGPGGLPCRDPPRSAVTGVIAQSWSAVAAARVGDSEAPSV